MGFFSFPFSPSSPFSPIPSKNPTHLPMHSPHDRSVGRGLTQEPLHPHFLLLSALLPSSPLAPQDPLSDGTMRWDLFPFPLWVGKFCSLPSPFVAPLPSFVCGDGGTAGMGDPGGPGSVGGLGSVLLYPCSSVGPSAGPGGGHTCGGVLAAQHPVSSDPGCLWSWQLTCFHLGVHGVPAPSRLPHGCVWSPVSPLAPTSGAFVVLAAGLLSLRGLWVLASLVGVFVVVAPSALPPGGVGGPAATRPHVGVFGVLTPSALPSGGSWGPGSPLAPTWGRFGSWQPIRSRPAAFGVRQRRRVAVPRVTGRSAAQIAPIPQPQLFSTHSRAFPSSAALLPLRPRRAAHALCKPLFISP